MSHLEVLPAVLALSAAACYAWAHHRVTEVLPLQAEAEEEEDWLSWSCLVVGAGLQLFMSVHGPSVVGVCSLLYYTIQALAGMLQLWVRKVEALSATLAAAAATVNDDDDLDSAARRLAEDGLRCCRAVQDFNHRYSPLVLFIYGYLLALASCYTYGAAVPLVAGFTALSCLFAAANLLLCANFLLAVFHLCHLGQELIDAGTGGRRALEDLVRAGGAAGRLSVATKHNVRLLCGRLEDYCKISPHCFFDLSHSCFLGLIAISITYMIVLLQFRE